MVLPAAAPPHRAGRRRWGVRLLPAGGVGDCRRDDLVQVLHHAVLEFGLDLRPSNEQPAFAVVFQDFRVALELGEGNGEVVGAPDKKPFRPVPAEPDNENPGLFRQLDFFRIQVEKIVVLLPNIENLQHYPQ